MKNKVSIYIRGDISKREDILRLLNIHNIDVQFIEDENASITDAINIAHKFGSTLLITLSNGNIEEENLDSEMTISKNNILSDEFAMIFKAANWYKTKIVKADLLYTNNSIQNAILIKYKTSDLNALSLTASISMYFAKIDKEKVKYDPNITYTVMSSGNIILTGCDKHSLIKYCDQNINSVVLDCHGQVVHKSILNKSNLVQSVVETIHSKRDFNKYNRNKLLGKLLK